jgi:hypothetical protein
MTMSDEFRKAIEVAIGDDDPEELLGVIIDVALAAEDVDWAQDCFLRLADHADTTVRGNAMVGFAHLAERFGELDAARVRPILEAGLRDREQYVREQAEAAVEALEQTLGW